MLQNIIYYLLKVIICSGLFTAYYYAALRNKRFHFYNRFYILMSIVLSVLLPLLHLQWFTFRSASSQAITLFNIINADGGEIYSAAESSFLNLQQLALFSLAFISFVMLLTLYFNIAKIYKLKKKFPVNKTIDFDFINTNVQQAPFSFLKNIFWRSDISLQHATGKQILQHEITHIKQKHSWDKIFIQLLLCFYWINPFYWLLKKELYLIHEFTADEEAVGKNDAAAFAKMLLTSQYGKFQFLPAQSIFYSPIKRRLLMLSTSKKSQFSYVRRLMILPLITAVICLFAFKVQNENSVLSTQKIIAVKPFVLVVDAGHGGKDLGAFGNNLYEKDVNLRIAEAIKKFSSDYGIDVVLTRKGDVYMSPKEKSTFANAQQANAFISIHINSQNNQPEKSGMEVYLPEKNPVILDNSKILGSAIIQNLQTNFNVIHALLQQQVGIWILNNSDIPAALIECGFLTNANDASALKNNAKIELMAKNILQGVALYANNKNSITPQKIINADTIPSGQTKTSSLTTPLYVLDGKMISEAEMKKIDPNTIESINVLKDKDATDKYGDKATNGVVEIILKKN
jgi:N-acetylmuramoyl-L-alanine amidase